MMKESFFIVSVLVAFTLSFSSLKKSMYTI